MATQILHRNDLPLGGFADLKEHQLVIDPRVFNSELHPGTWPGLGNFVYLADAIFNPKGETRMHDHKEVDVISVMIKGRIKHQGTLEHGTEVKAHGVQVQRAGGEGFSHNEVNPDSKKNRMIQIWVLPETPGQKADYKTYHPERGTFTRVYGGKNHDETFQSDTAIDIALLNKGGMLDICEPFIAYLAEGTARIDGIIDVQEGDMIRGETLHLEAESEAELIIIRA